MADKSFLADRLRRPLHSIGRSPMPRTAQLAFCLLSCAFWLPVAFGQTMYKSVTPDGRVTYSDHPPVDSKVVKTLTPDSSPSTALPISALDQLRKLRALRSAATESGAGVILYSASWCGYCAKAKVYLAAKGIAYREVDIDTPAGLDSFARAGGGKGVPLLVSGSRRIQGFSTGAYDKFFSTPE